MRGSGVRFVLASAAIGLAVDGGAARADEWTSAPSMAARRALHTATLLTDGRVLVAGGIPTYTSLEPASASAEIFDPASGAWSNVPPMFGARFEHCAARLADGRVLVAGGQNWTSNLVTVEIFDPGVGAWTAATSMFTTRHWCSATLLRDGRVLVAGGLHNADAVDVVEVYDPVSDAWSKAPPMSTARAMHTATLLDDGRVLLTGGTIKWDISGVRAGAEIFDPATESWSSAGDMAEPRCMHTATRLDDGRVLVAGGEQHDGPHLFRASAEVFDPVKGGWSATGAMHAERAGHVAALLGNGRVLVAGGHAVKDVIGGAEIYDPAAGAWVEVMPMHVSRDFSEATLLADGRVLVEGGSVSFEAPDVTHAEAEIFMPSTGTPCGGDGDCPSGFCVGGVCCDGACDGTCEVCTRAAGAVFDGACHALPRNADGDCKPPCVSARDCAAPLVCDGMGRCVSPPAMVSDFSGCRAAPRGVNVDVAMPWSLVVVGAIAAVWRRLRRAR